MIRYRKPAVALGVAALAALVLLGGQTMASAQPAESDETVTLTVSQESDIRDLLSRFAVDETVQDSLVDRIEAGEPWDVYDPSASPVHSEQRTIDGFDYNIDHYADGSISAIGVEAPEVVTTDGGISTQAITQCRIVSGSGYRTATGCQVDGVWGTVVIGAVNQSYTIVQGGSDKYNPAGYGYQQCLYPTTCSSAVRVGYKTTEYSHSGPAYARWQSDVTAPWGSWNVWVQLNVGGDRAWQTNS